MRLVKRFLTVLLETFFSYLIISQVGYIHSNDVVMETLSDSSALNFFFFFSNFFIYLLFIRLKFQSAINLTIFSNNIAGGLYSFNSCR